MASIHYDPVAALQLMVYAFLSHRADPVALEAGCGSHSHLVFPSSVTLVGIDISEKQLARSGYLHQKIHGDITTHTFPPDSFDLITCWDVLEHVPAPPAAIRKFISALKPGGLLIIKVPHFFSIPALITKFTPHAFHVWVYRHVFHFPNAGRDDYGPFPTFLRLSISPIALRHLASKSRLRIFLEATYESHALFRLRTRNSLIRAVFSFVGLCARIASLGLLDAVRNEYLLVLQKPDPNNPAQSPATPPPSS